MYDPSSQGAIDTIDFFQDLIGLSNESGPYGAGLAVRQGSQNYFAPPVAGVADSFAWETRSSAGLSALDFAVFNASGRPDSAASGGPITFGYWRSNTITGPLRTVQDGVDNWRVVVTPASNGVPEPATLGLFGLAPGLLAQAARRRPAWRGLLGPGTGGSDHRPVPGAARPNPRVATWLRRTP